MISTSGWGDDPAEPEKDTMGEAAIKGKSEVNEVNEVINIVDEPGVGGYLAYMAGEDENNVD